MKPAHRGLALRVGGAVISASLLLLVERCAREPSRHPPAVAPRSGPVTLTLPSPSAGPASGLRPPSPPSPPRPVTSAPAHPAPALAPHLAHGRQAGPSLVELIEALTARQPHRIVAANDDRAGKPGGEDPAVAAAVLPPAEAASTAQPPLIGAPASLPPPSSAAPASPPKPGEPAEQAAPVPPLRDLAIPIQPREPLLGVARDTTAPSPGAIPQAGLLSSANDNPVATTTADQPSTSAAPSTVAAGHSDLASPQPAATPAEPPAPASAASAPPSSTDHPQSADPATRELQPDPPIAATAATPVLPTPRRAAPPTHAGKGTAKAAGTGIAEPAAPLTGFSDDDELILELTTPGHEINETIVAYSRHGVPYLPLGELARILDLAVTVSDAGRYASGWVLDPAKTLAINLREGSVVVAGQSRKLAADDAVAFDGELYLRADRFADLFPLTLTTNLRAQTVTVQTRTPFPFQQRAARETARDQLRGRQGRRDGRQFERIVAPWRGFDVPLIDAELRGASDSTRGTRAEGDFRVAGDLAWLTARAFLSLDSQAGLTGARLELGRRDPDGGLLGPLRATEFGFGDISAAPLPLGLASVSGRGAFVTNAPLERASVFDKIELHGDLPDGYEAELYRNNILIDTATTPQDGQYRFLNIPVEFGLNVFRVVLYGPQGQRREVIRQISVGDGRLGPGEFQYALGTVQKNQPLFALHGRDYLPGPDDGSVRSSAQLQYGLTAGLTTALGGAVFDRLGSRHWLATAGLRSGFAGFALKTDLGLSDQAGRAFGLGLARRLAGFSVTLNHTEYRGGFVDEVRAFSDLPLRRVTELTVNGSLGLGGEGGLQIPINGIARDVVYADGHEVQSASLTQALPLSRSLQLSHLMEFDRTRSPLFGANNQLRGAFDLASLSRSSFQVRASLGYALLPTAVLTAAAVQLDRRIGERATISATAGRNFQADQNQFGLSALRRFDRFALSLDGNYSSNPNRYSAVLRLSFSLGRNPLDGRLFMAPTGLAGGGAVALHAFRDLDGDGRYEPGEPAVSDVRFFAGSENRATDGAGRVLLGRLGDGPRTSVRIDRDSLPDISLAPAVDGVELAPRAGRIVVHDFPIRALGELDGTAWFEGPAGARTVSGVIVLLLDPQGRTAARTRTGSDGTFWFEKLATGTYRLALDPGQAERLGIELVPADPVVVGPDGPSLRQPIHIRPTSGDKPKTIG